MENYILFEVSTPLGFRVRVTRGYWESIVTVKHPVMRERATEVQDVLHTPDEIRQSRSDPAVFLFYRPRDLDAGLCRRQTTQCGGVPHHDLSHRCYQRRGTGMEQVKIFHDRTGNTLTVWFGNPQEEYVCEETGDEVILMKDRTGRVIGFEKLNFSVSTPDQLQISFETVSM